MSAIISGKLLAHEYGQIISASVEDLYAQHKIRPGLSMIIVGDNPSSLLYVNNKKRMCERLNINSHIDHLRPDISEKDLIKHIKALNANPAIHGILLQLPLPGHLNANYILEHIDPIKDVDGLHPYNIGKLAAGEPQIVPCTPQGCMQLIHSVVHDISGMHAVVLGRSILVGKPMALLLCQANATVTLLHSKSRNIRDICKQADILVCATGQPESITCDYIGDSPIVIDVGITKVGDRIKGDVKFDEVAERVKAITPVPGGVGPMTVMNLMLNTLRVCYLQNDLAVPDFTLN